MRTAKRRGGAGPGEEARTLPQDRGQPGRVHPRDRREANRSYFGSCGLFCYDLAGKELWKYEMPLPTIGGGFGSGTSPILADGIVILVRDETKAPKIVALDLATGKLKWQKKRQSPVSYSTPVVWDTSGGKQIVAAGHGRMVGYDLKTGAEKWYVAGMPSGVCASPVAAKGSSSSPAGRRAAPTTRAIRCRRSTPCSSTRFLSAAEHGTVRRERGRSEQVWSTLAGTDRPRRARRSARGHRSGNAGRAEAMAALALG